MQGFSRETALTAKITGPVLLQAVGDMLQHDQMLIFIRMTAGKPEFHEFRQAPDRRTPGQLPAEKFASLLITVLFGQNIRQQDRRRNAVVPRYAFMQVLDHAVDVTHFTVTGI